MSQPQLYRGVWPQNVSKMAKYAVRMAGGRWKVSVLVEVETDLRYLAVDGERKELIERVNRVKQATSGQPGGAFYVNEYRHVIVPVNAGAHERGGSLYYYAGKLDDDFRFQFEDAWITSAAMDANGRKLEVGAPWRGPRPGIPYVLKAGAQDAYYEARVLTDAEPPAIRPGLTRQVLLSRVLEDPGRAAAAVAGVREIKGHLGGRFYVNEVGAMFAPIDGKDDNGIDYVYCGQIDLGTWFPKPPVPDE